MRFLLVILSVVDKTIHALTTCSVGFGSGNYYADCEYKEDGKIDLLIFYCPNRYAPFQMIEN